MSSERGPKARRYWSSLTGVGSGPIPERNWRGQTFWRRYLASFFVLPQPPGKLSAREARPTTAAEPRRARAPFLFRFQPALLAGTAVLAAVVVSVTQLGRGGGSGGNSAVGTRTGIGGASSPGTQPSTGEGNPPPTTSSSSPPPRHGPWQGTIRVEATGGQVTAGPKPGPGNIFGLGLSGPATLDGAGNLAQWTQDSAPTSAGCDSVLRANSAYQVTVKVGDQLCIATLIGGTASAKVADVGTDTSGNAYVDLNVAVY